MMVLTELPECCLGCAACEAVCPAVAADGDFAGPKVLGPGLWRKLGGGWPGEPPLGPAEALSLGADLCLQCHRCDQACPTGVPVSRLTRRAKVLARAASNGRGRAFVDRLLADQERVGRLVAGSTWARRLLRLFSAGPARRLEASALAALGLSPSRAWPEPAGPGFRARLSGILTQSSAARALPPVILFAGCHARFYEPAPALAAVKVLQRIGYRVVLPDQVCCGAPALGAGFEGQAAEALAQSARLLDQATRRFGGEVPIVSQCPSCTFNLREVMPELCSDAAARGLSRRVWDLGEFLAGPGLTGLRRASGKSVSETQPAPVSGAQPASLSGTATVANGWAYHAPCHLNALGVGRPFPGLLKLTGLGPPVETGPEIDGCCGMGGLSGLTRSGYARSLAAGARVLEHCAALARETGRTEETGRGEGRHSRDGRSGRSGRGPRTDRSGRDDPAPVVLSDCPLCRWQIGELTHLRTAHPVELLSRALDDVDSSR